jgi:NAD(P)H-nitrite reductase large subunit
VRQSRVSRYICVRQSRVKQHIYGRIAKDLPLLQAVVVLTDRCGSCGSCAAVVRQLCLKHHIYLRQSCLKHHIRRDGSRIGLA